MTKSIGILILVLMVPFQSPGQHVTDPHASLFDVAARRVELDSTADPLLRMAIQESKSCTKGTAVPAPAGRMSFPSHYLTGSNGPTNPAEVEMTHVYILFENRVAAGMNKYIATGSHAESACALAQLDAWAQAGALLNYDRDESQQAWFQVEWTLSAAGIAESVLVNDATLDAAQQKRVITWLDAAAHKMISVETPHDTGNNHHYWRGLAAASVGVVASDDELFNYGIRAYKDGINSIDSNGALPKEVARHENAIHYQGFALGPLLLIAQFASRQGVDLYSYEKDKRSIRDAIIFFGRAVDDPSLVKSYSPDEQKMNFGTGSFAEFTFYVARFGTQGLPPAIVNGLKDPNNVPRLGGSVTLLGAKAEGSSR